MYALIGGIAEAVFADRRICVYNYTITDLTTIVNGNIRIYYTIITDMDISSNLCTGINYTTVFDSCLISYCYEIMNMAVDTNFRGIGN